ncbi:rRNA maturation RNase YbeY [candidate division FCPU426 bacterium]|nr:rRNA maturation RNase YbeY [candidate division FCPU426 bacterium]
MPVHIRNEQTKVRIQQTAIRSLLAKCLRQCKLAGAEISVLLTDDKTIRRLNRKHRGENAPTDILTFGLREQRRQEDPLPPHPEYLGDLVVSLQTVQQQARQRGISAQEELEYVLVHGLLHLLGYDHANHVQQLRMEALQASMLTACRTK